MCGHMRYGLSQSAFFSCKFPSVAMFLEYIERKLDQFCGNPGVNYGKPFGLIRVKQFPTEGFQR